MMNPTAPNIAELEQLLWQMRDGAIDAAGRARIEELVTGDAGVRRFYIRYSTLCGGLRWLNSQAAEQREDLSPEPGPSLPAPGVALSITDSVPIIIHSSSHDAATSFPSFAGVMFSYSMAALLMGMGLLVGWAWKLPSDTQIANEHDALRSPLHFAPAVVGRITSMADCRFAADSKTKDLRPKTAVSLGDKLNLVSGLLEITYHTGARVILQGPVRYEVESPAGGFLYLGKLTARVENKTTQDQRPKTEDPSPKSEIRNPKSETISKSPNLQISKFVVRTPTALVTDLGTEFGVEVAKSGETTSHVFRGSIRVQRTSADGRVEAGGQVVRENQTVRVEGSPDNRQIVALRTFASSYFVREIPTLRLKVLDLVDVVAGGDGFSGRRNAGIDPATGRATDIPPPEPKTQKEYTVGDGKYHRVEAMPFVDGVFIPDGSHGLVQTDSAGHVSPEFPNTSNQTVGYVWAGGIIPAKPPFEHPRTVLGSIDYASSGHGLLFLHANKAVAFDLEAIRRANPGYKLLRFRSVAGNTETGSEQSQAVSADIWVLVDGHVRLKLREFSSYNGAMRVNIPIGDHDRFLTLAATDGGNGIEFDWIIFGDPRLELAPVKTADDSNPRKTR
jgi:hypothetical protein